MRLKQSLFTLVIAGSLVLAGCSGSGDGEAASSEAGAEAEATDGIRIVAPDEGAAIQAAGATDLIVLDVRTAEEFAEGHLDGAIMIDFYAEDFADQLAELDPNASYLLYCRSGNRSGQTTGIMADLGFADVAEVDGGIVAWSDAGLEVVPGS